MSQAQQSLLRHFLTGLGGALVARGYIHDSDLMEFIGTGTALGGAAWGVMDEWLAERRARDAKNSSAVLNSTPSAS